MPLQLAVMTSRLANGRKALNPRLIKSVGGVERPSGAAVPDLPFSQEHLAISSAGGMMAVANDVGHRLPPEPVWASGTSRWPARPARPRSAATTRPRRATAPASLGAAGPQPGSSPSRPSTTPRYAMSVLDRARRPRRRHSRRATGARGDAPVALLKDPEVMRADRDAAADARGAAGDPDRGRGARRADAGARRSRPHTGVRAMTVIAP